MFGCGVRLWCLGVGGLVVKFVCGVWLWCLVVVLGGLVPVRERAFV